MDELMGKWRKKREFMNIEEYREFCLSLGEVEEKLPFAKIPGGDSVLVFYVCGHTFCYCDLNDFSSVSLKCQPERIAELRESSDAFIDPDHLSPKYWIGVIVNQVPSVLLKELTLNSFEIVRKKYSKNILK